MIYDPIPAGKICRSCKDWKVLREFYKHPDCTDGHVGICKTCKAAYYQRNKPIKTEYQRTYWHQNTQNTVRYRAKNKDRIRANSQQYHREYWKTHRDKDRIYKQRREARKRSFSDAFTIADWRYALNYFNGCCAACGRPPGLWHMIAADHWIPLSSPDCLGTIPTNIVPLCHGIDGCNNNKSNRDPAEWLNKRFSQGKARRILKRIEDYFERIKSQH